MNMGEKSTGKRIVWEICKYLLVILAAMALSYAVSQRTTELLRVNDPATILSQDNARRINLLEEAWSAQQEKGSAYALQGKKIVYDGDSIAESRENNGGGYPALIAKITDSSYDNQAKGGAGLCPSGNSHCVVDNLVNLPVDGDLYCFEGGINDFWRNVPIGTCDPTDYTSEVDPNTICGAMETIFQYCLNNFEGKPVCFVIVHKVQNTGHRENANGNTFRDYRDAMVAVCEKYSVPYYDAFLESGLNGWNENQNTLFLTANTDSKPDGIHPNEEGYRRYYVPQLLDLFAKIMPVT